MSKRATFIDKVLDGEVLDPQEEILDEIDAWHDTGDTSLPIYEWLGMSRQEYALYVEKPKSLNFIFFARKHHTDIHQAARLAANDNAYAALAARGASSTEVAGIVKWLQETGRI
jgi:hypothetical protein